MLSGHASGTGRARKQTAFHSQRRANVILTAVGHNLRLVLAWLSGLLRFILLTLCPALTVTPALKWAS